jgi:nucleoside-diphosphate-sugar epimerase
LQIAAESGVEKFVYCSTCGVHGNVGREPVDETAPIAPADYYQYTKYQGERVALEFLGKGPQIVILRPTAIYGPGDPERFLKLFRLVQRGRFFMFGDGQVFYHPVYIDNLIDAFELAVSSGRGNGEAYLIGDEHYYTLDALVLAIAKTLHLNPSIRHLPFWPLWLAAVTCELLYKPLRIDPPLFRRRVDWFRQNRAFRIEKAKKELGYTPRVDLPNGLAQTAQWYRTHGYLS